MADVMRSLIEQLRAQFPGLCISRTRLHAWDSAYFRPSDLVKLIDHRGGNHRGADDPAAWKAFRDFFLHENRPTVKQAWEAVSRWAKEEGIKWCSLDSCYRQLDRRVPPELQARHREPKTYRHSFSPFIAQGVEAWGVGERWVGDHKQLDLWVRFGSTMIRPWLTAWIDWRTRRVCGWTMSDKPNSSTILAALRAGLLDERNMGGPSEVQIDNEKDYDAWVFHGQTKSQRRLRISASVDEGKTYGILNALSIKAHFSLPYNPNGKARMERWFRKTDVFCKTFDSYTGQSVETKPEQLNAILDDGRRVPSFELVKERLANFIEGSNASADHDIDDLVDEETRERLSPDAAMRRWRQRRRVMADPKALDLLLAQWHKPVPVTRNGITLNIAGRGLSFGQFEPAPAAFKGRSKEDRRCVLVAYDPDALRSVRVHDEQWRFICVARMNGVGGLSVDPLSANHVAELNRQMSAYERSQKHVAEHHLTSVLTSQEQLAEIAAKAALEQRAEAAESAPSMQMVRTPLDGQAKEVNRQELRAELKKAVGAESTIRRALPSLERYRQNITPAARNRGPSIDHNAKLREQNHAW